MKHIKIHPILESVESIQDFKESYAFIQEFFSQIEDENKSISEIKLLKFKISVLDEIECPSCGSDQISSKGYDYDYGITTMECNDCGFFGSGLEFNSEKICLEKTSDFNYVNFFTISIESSDPNLQGIHYLQKGKIKMLRNILSFYDMDIYELSTNGEEINIKGIEEEYIPRHKSKIIGEYIIIITTKYEYKNLLKLSKDFIINIRRH